MFVAKYDMLGQKELREHRDGSELSFVVALNDGFEGGGTNFIDMNAKTMKRKIVLVRPESVGDCVLFCGRHLHSGETITSGVRYILTGFVRVYVEDDAGKKTMVFIAGWELEQTRATDRSYVTATLRITRCC